jgi:hypothetical protein
MAGQVVGHEKAKDVVVVFFNELFVDFGQHALDVLALVFLSKQELDRLGGFNERSTVLPLLYFDILLK